MSLKQPTSSHQSDLSSQASEDSPETCLRSSSAPSYQAIDNGVMTSRFSDMINPDRSIWYILTLTVVLGALQMAWTVEFSECTPFLLSNLGLSKSILALVWIAGPMSGTIGQPVVGILSDGCNFLWGRRRPFIVGGAVVICATLLFLSHSVDIVGTFLSDLSLDHIKKRAVPFAITGIYVLDFSISAYQAASRAFIVDMVPSHQQQSSNAWAARMIGIFNIFGYYLASTDLTKLGFSGEGAQFRAMTWLAVFILMGIALTGCLLIKERDPRTDPLILSERRKTAQKLRDLGIVADDNESMGLKTLLYSLYKQTVYSISRLSPQVRIVNAVEFLAWIGYFPMLFYTTTYVGELYIYETIQKRQSDLPLSDTERAELLDASTRVGSTALLVHSISSLFFNMVLPHFVVKTEKSGFEEQSSPLAKKQNRWWKLPIKTTWTISHLIFALCTFLTFFVTTSTQAIVVFAFLGIPWGSALWAPFVLIGEEITRLKEKKLLYRSLKEEEDANKSSGLYMDMPSAAGSSVDIITDTRSSEPIDESEVRRARKLRLLRKYMEYEHESGIILGIHNVFVSAPQVVSSLFSSILFKLLTSGRDNDKFDGVYDESLGWVFRFGGLMAIGATLLSTRVKTIEQLEAVDLEEEI